MRKFFLALLIVVGVLVFYEFVLVKPPEPKRSALPPVEKEEQKQEARDILGESSAFSLSSLLESLSEEESGNPAQELEQTPQEEIPQDQAREVETQDPIQEALISYFLASSEIGFAENKAALALALYFAEDGNTKNLQTLIDDFENRQAAFRALLPPPQAETIHEESIAIVERYIQLMKDTRDKTKGSVQETWRSQEREEILDSAAALVVNIRTLVASYDLKLPPDVLP